MIRIEGVVMPDNQQILYALTLIYGIGLSSAKKILQDNNIDFYKKVKDLTEEEIKKIMSTIEKKYKVEGELREEVALNIKTLKEINCYRGLRHIKSLPVRGQRTRSNARTKRGKRKTVGALRKEVWAKLEQQQAQKAKK